MGRGCDDGRWGGSVPLSGTEKSCLRGDDGGLRAPATNADGGARDESHGVRKETVPR